MSKTNSLVLSCNLQPDKLILKTCAFINSGGNRFAFIDSNFEQKSSISVYPLRQPRTLRVVMIENLSPV